MFFILDFFIDLKIKSVSSLPTAVKASCNETFKSNTRLYLRKFKLAPHKINLGGADAAKGKLI